MMPGSTQSALCTAVLRVLWTRACQYRQRLAGARLQGQRAPLLCIPACPCVMLAGCLSLVSRATDGWPAGRGKRTGAAGQSAW